MPAWAVRLVRGWLLPGAWGTLPVVLWFAGEVRAVPFGVPLTLGGVVFAGAFYVVRRPWSADADGERSDGGEPQ